MTTLATLIWPEKSQQRNQDTVLITICQFPSGQETELQRIEKMEFKWPKTMDGKPNPNTEKLKKLMRQLSDSKPKMTNSTSLAQR